MKKIKHNLDSVYEEYIQKNFEDFDYAELSEMWKMVDYAPVENKDKIVGMIASTLKENINHLQLPDLLNFTHLRIKSEKLYAIQDRISMMNC